MAWAHVIHVVAIHMACSPSDQAFRGGCHADRAAREVSDGVYYKHQCWDLQTSGDRWVRPMNVLQGYQFDIYSCVPCNDEAGAGNGTRYLHM